MEVVTSGGRGVVTHGGSDVWRRGGGESWKCSSRYILRNVHPDIPPQVGRDTPRWCGLSSLQTPFPSCSRSSGKTTTLLKVHGGLAPGVVSVCTCS